MKRMTAAGPAHPHPGHGWLDGLYRALHRPETWIAAAVAAGLVALFLLALVHGTGTQPAGWDPYLWIPD